MLDLKRFLRFEISGYVAILYSLVFCAVFMDIQALCDLKLLTNARIIDYSVTGFILAAPLGFLMHQIDISIFSPFKKHRLFYNKERKVIKRIHDNIEKQRYEYEDDKCQAYLEEALGNKGAEHIDNEISNRYSYYYARVEAGLFSPLFGFVLFLFYYSLINSICPECILKFSILSVVATILIIIISIAVLSYIPTLFREIDDLVCLAIEAYTKKQT